MTDLSIVPDDAPRGLAFLALGERLRRRGQLDAAATVALAGISHYPSLADAHDLLGRIRADQDDGAGAVVAWQAALECDPSHPGARKGLAYLAFRGRDYATAERHLEAAVRDTPRDPTVIAALDRVRAARPAQVEEPLRLDDKASGVMLFDGEGMRLVGGLGTEVADDRADAAAAEGAGVVREAERTARLLGLGAWRQVVVEGPDARLAFLPVAPDTTLVVFRTSATPIGRVVATGNRAVQAARDWLGRMA